MIGRALLALGGLAAAAASMALPARADVLTRVHPFAPSIALVQRPVATAAQSQSFLAYYGGPILVTQRAGREEADEGAGQNEEACAHTR